MATTALFLGSLLAFVSAMVVLDLIKSSFIRLFSNSWVICFTIISVIILGDQIVYQMKKGNLPGPVIKIPIIGSFLDSKNPKFESYLEKWESGPLSCISVFHKFVVIATTNELARRILSVSDYSQPSLVDAGKKLLTPSNWVFLDGKAHIEYRKGLNSLFTQRSLSIYLPQQQEIYQRVFKNWLDISKNGYQEFMFHFRSFMIEVSCRTFCGEYISLDRIKQIEDNYINITAAMELVNFPFAIPGTKLWRGIQARKLVIRAFEEAAKASRISLLNGGKVTCMLDNWIEQMIMSQRYEKGESSDRPSILIRNFSDFEIAQVFLSFLFASQDATSSAMCWLFQHLADHTDVLQKMRQEQIKVREGDLNKQVDYEMVEKMIYTRAVVKESLRIRPPVLMVPYRTKKAYPITPDYTVPKDSMIIPTFWPSLHDKKVFPNPHEFIPDRWLPGGDALKHPKNWLVFGNGPHMCIGQQYTLMHLMVSAGMASLQMDWKHDITPQSDEQMIFATTFPKDRCRLLFTPAFLEGTA